LKVAAIHDHSNYKNSS